MANNSLQLIGSEFGREREPYQPPTTEAQNQELSAYLKDMFYIDNNDNSAMPSVEDEQNASTVHVDSSSLPKYKEGIEKAYETGNPIVELEDGWHGLVYSCDGSGSKESACMDNAEYKFDSLSPSSVKMRSDNKSDYYDEVPGISLNPDEQGEKLFTVLVPRDRESYDAWKAQRVPPETTDVIAYASSCAHHRTEINLSNDDPVLKNTDLLNTLQQYEKTHLQSNVNLSSPASVLDMSAHMPILGMVLGSGASALAQHADGMLDSLDKQFGGANTSYVSTVILNQPDSNRILVDESLVDDTIKQQKGFELR